MIYNTSITQEERFHLPLSGPGNYRVRDNIIYTQIIEFNAVRHCNLSCRSCSHISPIAAKKYIDPSIVGQDLRALSRFMKCKVVRILGGEPLLHPSLEELLKEVKHSNISTDICIATNGTLLQLINNEMAQYIDSVHISLYPLEKRQSDKIKRQADRLAEMGIHIELKEIPFFRESLVQNPTENPSIINTVYETCLVAHLWRCLTINDGRLYRCPQSLVYAEGKSDDSDSINIRDLKCVNDLLRFIENNNACRACAHCLGSVGKLFPYEQIKRENWQAQLPMNPEEGIDLEYAESIRKYYAALELNRLQTS